MEALSNPYIENQQEHDDREQWLTSSRRHWQYLTVALLVVCALSVSGNLYQLRDIKVIPYVVQTDLTGQVVTVGPMARDDDPHPEDKIIRAHLAAFVRNARTITTDRILMKRMIQQAYAVARGEAVNYLNTTYQAQEPFARAASETVQVSILSVLPQSPDSWHVRWQEDVRNPQGMVLRKEQYEGIFTTTIRPDEVDMKSVWLNPKGIFITALQWTRSAA
jgi:type IV secretion system protein VirB5